MARASFKLIRLVRINSGEELISDEIVVLFRNNVFVSLGIFSNEVGGILLNLIV